MYRQAAAPQNLHEDEAEDELKRGPPPFNRHYRRLVPGPLEEDAEIF